MGVQLAGDSRGRFLTASSKVSQNTSGDWCGRQGGEVTTGRGDRPLLLEEDVDCVHASRSVSTRRGTHSAVRGAEEM
jgi:hypothetical protein